VYTPFKSIVVEHVSLSPVNAAVILLAAKTIKLCGLLANVQTAGSLLPVSTPVKRTPYIFVRIPLYFTFSHFTSLLNHDIMKYRESSLEVTI